MLSLANAAALEGLERGSFRFRGPCDRAVVGPVLGGFGSPARLHTRLAQPLGPQAPALGPQPHVLTGVRDQRLMFFGDSRKRFEACARGLQLGNDRAIDHQRQRLGRHLVASEQVGRLLVLTGQPVFVRDRSVELWHDVGDPAERDGDEHGE